MSAASIAHSRRVRSGARLRLPRANSAQSARKSTHPSPRFPPSCSSTSRCALARSGESTGSGHANSGSGAALRSVDVGSVSAALAFCPS
eukprot:3020311-Rhodomonas_salina.2